MTLADYRAKHGLSLEQLADLIGTSKQHVAQIIGGASCRMDTAFLIVSATGGEVAYEDLVTDDAREKAEAKLSARAEKP